ncbi:Multi-sensor hybrid histidine kinase (fragment) [uncultured Desulfobacterium sp.]|uniref:histidine kinase n=1 Tax=uncultured Desulfobacterium sp. TaxID=201089 RepID=A0A445MW11_9BACT
MARPEKLLVDRDEGIIEHLFADAFAGKNLGMAGADTEFTFRKIAHDFNNLLSVIMGNVEITIKSVAEHSQIRMNLEDVLDAGKRAQDLVRKMMTVGLPTGHQLELLEVQSVVKCALRLMRTSLPANIEVSENLNDGSLILADYSQIHRVIMNLCTNACQAMEKSGGRLSVTLFDTDLSPEDCRDLSMTPGSYVCLSVGDTGHGIDTETMSRIFEPFFSTKARGNGLGLHIVREIIDSYGGDIIVKSDPGKWTEFIVYLPRIYH